MEIIKSYNTYRKVHKDYVSSMECVVDGRYYYVYRITDKINKKHYYGSRVSVEHPKMDLGLIYMSSSNDIEFMKDQEEYPQRFKYKIVRIFENNIDKILYESFLHQYFNVKNHKKFINRSNQLPSGFDTTGYISCKHKETHQTSIVSKQEFNKNDNLVGLASGMVNCFDKNAGVIKQVTKYEFDASEELVGVCKGKLSCYDNTIGKYIQMDVDEFSSEENKGRYTAVNAGMVSCKSIITGELFQVCKEQFYSDESLVGVTKGCKLDFSEEHKLKIKEGLTGKPKSEEHRKNISLSNKGKNSGKISCKNIITKEIVSVYREEFDSNPNLVGVTKNIDKYSIKTPDDGFVDVIGMYNFRVYCKKLNISYKLMLISRELGMLIEDSSQSYKRSSEQVKNSFGYQLLSIEEV